MDRRLFAAVQANAKRAIAARAAGASETEIEALREEGRRMVEVIREQIEAGEPDTASPEERRLWEDQERKREAPRLAAEWFWSRIP